MPEFLRLTVEVDASPTPQVRTFAGRDAWTLSRLLAAGERGVTPLENPAPRWSHYVFRLRRAGIEIETIDAPNTGAFGGRHGRYVLRSAVTVLGQKSAG